MAPTSAVQGVADSLNTTYEVTITTGRTFVGLFKALDSQGNLVLDHAHEHLNSTAPTTSPRQVGLVIIPRRWWHSVHALSPVREPRSACAPV